jgi:dephospho-CoA kinase
MAAAKKFIIGLTGNIATGKSVVRKMLEHLGAYGIDADVLGHRVIEKGAPGYKLVVDQFGKFILDDDGNIDRGKLGKVAFADPEALKELEEIVHPYVTKAVDHLVSKASQDVIVVEAIKLLESPLKDKADTIWVTTSSEANQLSRLALKRGMSEEDARQVMDHQSPQGDKAAISDTLIKNDGSIEDTWKEVQGAWMELFPDAGTGDTVTIPAAPLPATSEIDLGDVDLQVARAKPSQAQDIADFINRTSGGKTDLARIDVMTAFGEKAFLLLVADSQMVGVVGWQVENLVARVDEIWLEDGLNLPGAMAVLTKEIEEASRQLQAEAALVFVGPELANEMSNWNQLGYEARPVEELKISAWQEAARDSHVPGTEMLFKQLRIDRVLRPL